MIVNPVSIHFSVLFSAELGGAEVKTGWRAEKYPERVGSHQRGETTARPL
jgi:hypothetical protein